MPRDLHDLPMSHRANTRSRPRKGPRRLGAVALAVLALGVSLLTTPQPASATSSEQALTPDEQAALEYDRQCESLAVDDCATYNAGEYDANWRTFENPVTGEDYLPPGPIGTGGWYIEGITTERTAAEEIAPWTCAGAAANPTYQLGFIQGEAQQTCAGSGWAPQRVIVAIQWKHVRRFWRDRWVTVAQTNGDLEWSAVNEEGTLATCPGTRKRTFRTAAQGYAANDRYTSGPKYSNDEVKLPCDRTS